MAKPNRDRNSSRSSHPARLRVAMLGEHPDSDQPIDGGVEAVTSYLVDALVAMPDIELHVVSFRLGLRQPATNNRNGYTHHLIPYGKYGAVTAFRSDQRQFDACLARIRPHVVHSQGGGHSGILAKRSPYPSVVTVHGILSREAPLLPGIRERIRTRIQALMADHYCIRGATHTILISQYVADHYGQSLAGQHYQVPNPVDPRFFRVTRQEESGRVLFAGRLYALKGVKELIRAISRLPDSPGVRLVLAGAHSDAAYVESLRAEIAQLGLGDAVELAGSLTMEALLQELSRCACLVLPSFQETAPMVIQEAMAAGVPVIATDVGGIPFQVEHGASGFLVKPGDVDSLASRLDELLNDEALRKRFGAAAKAKAEDEYDAQRIAARTVAVYREAIAE